MEIEIEKYRLMCVDPYMRNVLEHQVDCLEKVEGFRACLRDYPGQLHFDHTNHGGDNPVHGNLIARQELPPITGRIKGKVLDRTMENKCVGKEILRSFWWFNGNTSVCVSGVIGISHSSTKHQAHHQRRKVIPLSTLFSYLGIYLSILHAYVRNR